MGEKKYYWLKLKRDFFKRHDIQILEAIDNGKDYVLFYLKLLLESIDHDGNLRFSKTIPYNEKMLSVVTNTNIDVVKSAMEKLIELGLIEIMADSTIYMNEVEKMLGTETYWAEQKRKQRGNELKLVGQCPQNVQDVQLLSNQEKEKEIEIDKDKKKKNSPKQKKEFIPPTIEEIKKYIIEKELTVNGDYFLDYFAKRDWVDSNGNKVKSWRSKILTWDEFEKKKNNNKQEVLLPERRLTPEEQIVAAKAKYFIK